METTMELHGHIRKGKAGGWLIVSTYAAEAASSLTKAKEYVESDADGYDVTFMTDDDGVTWWHDAGQVHDDKEKVDTLLVDDLDEDEVEVGEESEWDYEPDTE